MNDVSEGRPTVYDVARVAGVSIKTVSRVVNQSPGVSAKTRRLVLDAVQELGYVVNEAARSLVTGSSTTIGVIVDSIADPFFASLVSVVEVDAMAAGFSTQVASTWRDPLREREQVLRMTRENVRGLLLAPTPGDHGYLAVAGRLPSGGKATLPIVLIDRGWPDSEFDTVGVDDRADTRAAIEHLLARGHRRIAFVADDLDLPTIRNRRDGYRDAVTAAGEDEMTVGESEIAELLRQEDPPTAIFSSNARTSLGVVRALHRAGRATDVALISFGDFELSDTLQPGVTVVDHDPARIAAAAVDRLLTRIRGAPLEKADILLPTELVPRGSGELPCVQS